MCAPGQSWSYTVGAGAPIRAHAGQHWHFVGDSITNFGWFAAAGGFVDQINALVGGAGITVTSYGLGGDKVGGLAPRVHERVAIYRPDVIVVEIGFNDAPAATPSAQFRADYDSILIGCRAECPNAQLMSISILTFQEQWLSGPLRWSPSATQTNIDTLNVQIAASAAALGAAYVDVRAPALVYESTHNTPEPGVTSGILTLDSIHPNPTGQVLMGTTAMGSVVLG